VQVKSIGIDIEEIDRFSRNKYEKKRSFYHKIFTQKEIDYCLSKSNPYQHFAVRFCAKEAVIKALNDSNLDLLDIEIKIKNREPVLCLPMSRKGIVSLSHTQKYAIAVVLIH